MAHPVNRRLLLIVAEFPPRGGGGVLRVTKLVKYLAPLGWDITVVCSDEPVGETADTALLQEIPESVRVIRTRGPFRAVGMAARSTVEASRGKRGGGFLWDGARSIARAFAVPDRWLGWSLKVGRMSASEIGRPQVILSSGPPHSAHLAAAKQARKLRIPFAIDLRDDWAGNPLFASAAPWRDPIDYRLERRTIRKAAAVVLVSEASRTIYSERYPAIAGRFHAIPNGFDPEDLPAHVPMRDDPTEGAPIRFVHPGSLRYDRAGGDLMFDAFGAAMAKDPSLVLHLLGSVSPSNAARAQEAIPAANLSLDGFVPHEEALRRMAAADVLVVISNVFEAGAGTMTGKIFECLAVRRPILLISPRGPAADLVESSGAGVVADPRDPVALDRAIHEAARLARSPEFRGAAPEAMAKFDRRVHAETWSLILDRAIGTAERVGPGR
jgi:glycosyltransferase involved in cell wall biosynthesis